MFGLVRVYFPDHRLNTITISIHLTVHNTKNFSNKNFAAKYFDYFALDPIRVRIRNEYELACPIVNTNCLRV